MSRTQEEIIASYKQKLQNTVLKRLKPNPDHYPIVNKWNYKYVVRPNLYEIFDIIEEAMDEIIGSNINITEEIIKDCIDMKVIGE